jgi:hypothetical protein
VFNNSISSNTTLYSSYNTTDILARINENNAILLAQEELAIMILAQLDDGQCEDYVFITLDQWTRMYLAMIVRSTRRDVVEMMNVVIAERMSRVDETIQSMQLTEECRKHVFPVYEPNLKYFTLKLDKFIGTFMVLFMFLFMSILVLAAEKIYDTLRKKDKLMDEVDDDDSFEIQIKVGKHILPNVKREIRNKYAEILHLLDNNACL